jgi:hypothetical protein
MSNPHLLARSANIDSTLPVQPMSTRLRAPIRPTIASIELGNEHQPSMIRRIEMTSKLSDLRREIIDGEVSARGPAVV